jgi:hypothetical protein
MSIFVTLASRLESQETVLTETPGTNSGKRLRDRNARRAAWLAGFLALRLPLSYADV